MVYKMVQVAANCVIKIISNQWLWYIDVIYVLWWAKIPKFFWFINQDFMGKHLKKSHDLRHQSRPITKAIIFKSNIVWKTCETRENF
jgi:hypothetical protein